ncbi:hypothetical protein B0H19DRAFT_1227511 [Mycena capillaripes]|nr:hypothetical protein B0H19DRAFT_1227511 [Mycena capillaripes]
MAFVQQVVKLASTSAGQAALAVGLVLVPTAGYLRLSRRLDKQENNMATLEASTVTAGQVVPLINSAALTVVQIVWDENRAIRNEICEATATLNERMNRTEKHLQELELRLAKPIE